MMNLDKIDREKCLELFGKFIRTKKIDNLQGEQRKRGPEPTDSSKQKLTVKIKY